jgi:hypothetical protein
MSGQGVGGVGGSGAGQGVGGVGGGVVGQGAGGKGGGTSGHGVGAGGRSGQGGGDAGQPVPGSWQTLGAVHVSGVGSGSGIDGCVTVMLRP